MSSLWFLVAFVAAHTRMAQLARHGRPWYAIEAEADHWAEVLDELASWGKQLPLPGHRLRWRDLRGPPI